MNELKPNPFAGEDPYAKYAQIGPIETQGETNMADPFSVAAAGAGVVKTLGSFFNKGNKVETGLKIPKGFEYQYIDQIDESLGQIQQDMEKLQTLEAEYSRQMEVYSQAIEGQILPEEATKALQESNLSIASSLGMSAQELAENGLLSEDDAQDLAKLQEIEGADYKDPRLVNQLNDQKAQLTANLKRKGASPQEISQALSEFERDAEEKLFSRSQELKTSQAGLVTSRMSLRNQTKTNNLNNIFGTMNSNQGLLNNSANAAAMGANIANSRASVGTSLFDAASRLRTERTGQFTTLGEFKLSGQAKDYAEKRGEMTAEEHKEEYKKDVPLYGGNKRDQFGNIIL